MRINRIIAIGFYGVLFILTHASCGQFDRNLTVMINKSYDLSLTTKTDTILLLPDSTYYFETTQVFLPVSEEILGEVVNRLSAYQVDALNLTFQTVSKSFSLSDGLLSINGTNLEGLPEMVSWPLPEGLVTKAKKFELGNESGEFLTLANSLASHDSLTITISGNASLPSIDMKLLTTLSATYKTGL